MASGAANLSTKDMMNTALRPQGLECSSKCCCSFTIASLASAALLIIGCMAATGAFPGAKLWGVQR